MRFSKTVVKQRIPILVIALLLMIPATWGMISTRVNYDMLDYLPQDMDTVIGQGELLNEFGKGAFSILILEDMKDKDVDLFKNGNKIDVSPIIIDSNEISNKHFSKEAYR